MLSDHFPRVAALPTMPVVTHCFWTSTSAMDLHWVFLYGTMSATTRVGLSTAHGGIPKWTQSEPLDKGTFNCLVQRAHGSAPADSQ
jgi:hypothetical protein